MSCSHGGLAAELGTRRLHEGQKSLFRLLAVLSLLLNFALNLLKDLFERLDELYLLVFSLVSHAAGGARQLKQGLLESGGDC